MARATGLEKLTYGFFGIVLIILMVQALQHMTAFTSTANSKPIEKPCSGEPILVDYPYEGKWIEPHACAVQCEDEVQRYVYYTNNLATQCERLPGCNDWGEDHGITCKPDAVSVDESE